MKMKNILIIFVLSVTFISCGPVIGQLMRVSEGVKKFEVTSGDINDLKSTKNILVYGPFTKGEKGWHICKGEDATEFANKLAESGLFASEAYVERDSTKFKTTKESLKSKSGADMKNMFGLKSAPDTIMFGTIVERDTVVAPARGIIMNVEYKLNFYNIASKKETVIRVRVKELSQDAVTTAVEKIKRELKD